MKPFIFAFVGLVLLEPFAVQAGTIPDQLSQESGDCLECHRGETPAITEQWGASKHFRANVSCYECHQAQAGDPDAFDHNGFLISTIVSPKDCARCHTKEVAEFERSHHAKAARILGSLDNRLADVVEGNRGFVTEGFPEGVS